MTGSPVQFAIRAGPPVSVGKMTITPYARSISLGVNLPQFNWGLVWNRPASVGVRVGDGPEQRLPVIDRTRLLQLAVLGMGVLGGMIIRRIFYE